MDVDNALTLTMSSRLSDALPPLFILLPAILLLPLFGYTVHNLFFHPLRSVPGPRFAAITPLYEVALYSTGKSHEHYQRLHDTYGPIVRISPNTVMINHPQHLPQLWSWAKGEWWLAIIANPEVVPHNSQREVRAHVAAKKKVASAYSMSSVAKYEGIIDKHIAVFIEQMRKKSREGKIFDLSPWMQWLAFDIVMDVVFSNPLGMVEQGRDVDGLIASLHELLHAASVMAMLPVLSKMMHRPLAQKYLAPKPTDKRGPGKIHGLAYEQVRTRMKLLDTENEKALDKPLQRKPDDVLQRILEQNKDRASGLSAEMLEQESIAPIMAGSDSVASYLRSAILYVASTPRVLDRLRAEIDAADLAGKLGPTAQYNEIREHVPFVDPISKEVFRIYPVATTPMPRVVPNGGAVIHGYNLPEGTNVGTSQWCVGRNREVFGDDVELFRPERWEHSSEESDSDQFRDIEAASIPFHAGPMMCTGKHIAMLEIHKTIVAIFRHLDIQVVNVRQPWDWDGNNLAMVVRGFDVKITERKKKERD